MKKAIKVLLAILLVSTLVAALSACGEADPCEKGYHAYVSSVTTAPTCTSEGVRTFTCSRCNASYTDKIAKTNHVPVTLDGKPATCADAGLTDGVKCSVCNTILTEQQTLELVPHKFGEAVESKAPTCTEAGEAKRTCSVCGEQQTVAVPATGHTWVGGKVIKEPTCVENGVREYACSVCGETKQGTILMVEHNYGEWIEETSQVVGHYHCDVCGNNFDRDYNLIYDMTHIHTYVEVPAVPATCTTTGVMAHWQCSVCKLLFLEDESGNKVVTDEAALVTPKAPHEYAKAEHVSGTWTHKAVCANCGDAVTDNCVPELNVCPTCSYTYTPDEILTALSNLASGNPDNTLAGTYELQGTLTSIVTAYSSQYGNITVNMLVGNRTIQAYRAVGADGATVKVGAIIKVSGSLGKHYAVEEFMTGCQLTFVTYPTVSIETRSEHGKVLVDGAPIGTSAQVASTIKFTLQPDEGWKAASVKVNGIKVTAAADGSYSFDVTGDTVIEVKWIDADAVEAKIATFNFGADDSTKINESNQDGSETTSYTETDGDYTLTLSGMSKVYKGSYDAKGGACLKLGTGSVVGKFSFTVPEDVEKVVIYVAGYKNKNASVQINTDNAISVTTKSANGEYTPIEVDTSETKTVTFTTTTNADKRCKVTAIEYWGLVVPCKHHGGLTKHDKVDAKCGQAGTAEYWQCDECQAMFSDEQGQHPIEQPDAIPALSHSYTVWTDDHDGNHSSDCDNGCGERSTEPHTYVEGVCSKCNAAQPVENFHVTVNITNGSITDVTGADALEGDHQSGTTIKFKVTANEGFVVKSVMANSDTLQVGDDGYYTLVVSAAITVEVTIESKPAAAFVKITSLDNFVDGGQYLIVYEAGNLVMDITSIIDATGNKYDVTINGSKIAYTEEIMKKAFTITKSGSNYLIKSSNDLYIGNTANKNQLKATASTINNTISFNSDGTVNIVSNNTYLKYNSDNTSGTRFRYYKSGQNAICLYQYQA